MANGRQPARGVVGQERRDADGDGHGDHESEHRAQHGDHEQIADAEPQVVRVGGDELGAGDEVDLVGPQRRYRLIIRNSAINAIAPMMVAPAAMAIESKMVSPRPAPWPFKADAGVGFDGMSGVSPICCGLAPVVDEPTAVGSGVTAIGP